MSSWSTHLRKLEAAEKRQQREELKSQKELERRMKEQAKLTAIEQARLEVEAHENALAVLLSVHKQQSEPFDWSAFASALPPHEPPRLARNEAASLFRHAVAAAVPGIENGKPSPDEARALDEREYESTRAEYERDFADWERMRSLAKRVLAGEAKAYSEAVSEFSSLSEIANLGSSISITVHNAKLIGCALKVNGRDSIPSEVKSLTAAGKLSVKAMPKARFHEIYQDYVCGCVLRVAREMFALLPVETVLMTATVDGRDSRTGRAAELPVLSVIIPRAVLAKLDFKHLVPSDSLANFQHNGDVMASRKSGEFEPIAPLKLEDVIPPQPAQADFDNLVNRVRQHRGELAMLLATTVRQTSEQNEPNSQSE